MKGTASQEILAKLHDLLATQMTEILTCRPKDDNGVDLPVTPQELNVIRQFLKDNGVDAAQPDTDADAAFQNLLKSAENSIEKFATN